MTEQTALLAVPSLPMPHGFFTRQGGVSTGPYASLNCSTKSADDPARVRQNRALAVRAIGADPALLFGINQVHGTEVACFTSNSIPSPPPTADAMVTNQTGITLGIITADCAPVLFADCDARIIGAAHAGWRGAVAGVLEATLNAMQALGALRSRIRAAIGPAIGPASYEVGTDLRDAVLARDARDCHFFTPARRDAHWLFDLPNYCRARLAAAGVTNTVAVSADTAADAERFFSNRRRNQRGGGPIGHQISLIMLPSA